VLVLFNFYSNTQLAQVSSLCICLPTLQYYNILLCIPVPNTYSIVMRNCISQYVMLICVCTYVCVYWVHRPRVGGKKSLFVNKNLLCKFSIFVYSIQLYKLNNTFYTYRWRRSEEYYCIFNYIFVIIKITSS